jgi:hypothetical protein
MPMHRGLAHSIVTVALLAGATACIAATGPNERAYETSLDRWRSSGLVNYRYKSAISCFCGADFIEPVTITVRNGVVTSVTDRVTGAARSSAGRFSIDSLFALVATEIRERPNRLQVTYDAILRYPRTLTYGTPENDGGGYITADSVVAIP